MLSSRIWLLGYLWLHCKKYKMQVDAVDQITATCIGTKQVLASFFSCLVITWMCLPFNRLSVTLNTYLGLLWL